MSSKHDPAAAVQLLRSTLRVPFLQRMPIVAYAYNILYGAGDRATWLSLFTHGFVQVLLDMLFEVEFVGMTIAQFNSLRDNDFKYYAMHYSVWIINQFSLCLAQFWSPQGSDSQQGRKVITEAKSVALSRLSRFWACIFQTRRVLLDDKTRDYLMQNDAGVPLEEGLLSIAESIIAMRTTATGGSEMLYTLLHMWIHLHNTQNRHAALQLLYYALHRQQTPEFLSSFYDGAIKNVAEPALIAACRLRDLKNPTYIDERFTIITASFHFLSPAYTQLKRSPLNTHPDTQAFLYVLAAGRRQLCLGANEPRKSDGTSLASTVGYIRNVMICPPRGKTEGTIELPEHCYHMILPLVSRLLVARVAGSPHAETEVDMIMFKAVADILHLTTGSFKLIRQRKPLKTPLSPHLRAMRQLTLKCHSDTAEVIDKEAKAFRDTRMAECIRGWRNLKTCLPPCPTGPPGEPSWRFPIGKGCDWKGCLCNVYRPAHPMQVCSGCWSVAYCGRRCQNSAWKEGHNDQCSKRHFQGV